MKANELMIGDWVKFPTSDLCHKVYAVQGKSVKIDKQYWHKADKLQPIPLTAEILKKNGFEVQEQGGGRKDVWIGFGLDCEGDIEVEFQHNIPTHLKIDGGFKGEYYISTNIKYIHELQHALRLCGIEKEIEL